MQEMLMILISNVLAQPPHEKIVINARDIPHPRRMGFRKDIGAPTGQSEDYRLALKDGRSIHAQKHGRKWLLHWDKLDPMIDKIDILIAVLDLFKQNTEQLFEKELNNDGKAIDKIEHLRVDAPEYYTLTTTGIGAGFGAAVGGCIGAASESEDGIKKGALVGIGIGSLVGAMVGILTGEWEE